MAQTTGQNSISTSNCFMVELAIKHLGKVKDFLDELNSLADGDKTLLMTATVSWSRKPGFSLYPRLHAAPSFEKELSRRTPITENMTAHAGPPVSGRGCISTDSLHRSKTIPASPNSLYNPLWCGRSLWHISSLENSDPSQSSLQVALVLNRTGLHWNCLTWRYRYRAEQSMGDRENNVAIDEGLRQRLYAQGPVECILLPQILLRYFTLKDQQAIECHRSRYVQPQST